MTPIDIATDVSTCPTGGTINSMTTYTYTFTGMGQRIDDSNTFG